MAKKENDLESDDKFVARFNLAGLVIFSMALVLAGGLLAYSLRMISSPNPAERNLFHLDSHRADTAPAEMPAWGELKTADITLEAPEEYIAFELKNNKPVAWTFQGLRPEQVRALLTSCGVPAAQISRALSPALTSFAGANTVIKPDDALIFALSPETRHQLYRELAKFPANHYMQFPFVFPGRSFDECFRNDDVPAPVEALVRKLLYSRGDAQCFSDYEIVMQHLPTEVEKINLLKALSRQSAVLARLRIRPDTDVEKIIGYWDKSAKAKDVRPLLESMTRIPDGSTISLLYLLPQFARQRLYTFPLPSEQDDPVMDCHWTTMNFFNDTPDNRFTDTTYTVTYLKANYYTIAKPTSYGDIILFLDESGNAIHSAVYIADDLVFTKNGNNFAQPWKLTHLKSLTARYELDSPERLMVWRRKNS